MIRLASCCTLAFAGSVCFRPSASSAPSPLEKIGDTSPSKPRATFGPRIVVSTSFGTSYQVNVNAAGQNILGDAANEPSLCVDPLHPNRIAIGWRQFNSITNNFRQAGWAFSTNNGVNWTLGGVLETNVFRSDPVLASDADGRFYYLSLQQDPVLHCDLWRSTNGGASWKRQGPAVGGDKPWMTVDTSSSPGRGKIYQVWSDAQNVYSNRVFSLSADGGNSWSNPIAIPQTPFWNTVDVGPHGELYVLGWNGTAFWFTRSLNATNPNAALVFDLSLKVDLGGRIGNVGTSVNPEGLLGQPWIAADRSSGPTRGYLYALCTVSAGGNPADVMFIRSTNGGSTWSAPARLNDAGQNVYHWFGTLSVAPNGRIDACWYDTRSNPSNNFSELYYISSYDAGLSWTANRAVSPPFNHTLGYPSQQKIGDYIGMISLENSACIAYTATFNGEEDVYFIQLYQPILATIGRAAGAAQISWNAVIGKNYCIQYQDNLLPSWTAASNLACISATNTLMQLVDPTAAPRRFYRIRMQMP